MKIRRFLIFLLCALAVGLSIPFGIRKFSAFGSIAGHTTRLKQPIPAYTRSLRPNYPYSIIPGGAYSAAELRNADEDDPVVKEHYADFDMKKAQMVQLTDDRRQYVSYRLKKKVYWTKKRLRIPKGEVLLTDGENWARARCGNRLSNKPHKEVSDQEPSVKALSLPPMQLGTAMDLAESPVLGELSAIPPVDIDKFPPVLPSGDTPPPELQPLAPVIPIGPVVPVLPPLFPTGVPTITPGPPGYSPPGTTSTVPTAPIVIPPDNNPPISTVPEPKAVYLFLITFVLSLYGLTRLVPVAEKTDTARSQNERQP
jgi:hypothetical protein